MYLYSISCMQFPVNTSWDTLLNINTPMSKAHDSNETPNDGTANKNWGITFCNVIMIHVIKHSHVKYMHHLGKVSSFLFRKARLGTESPSLNVNDNIIVWLHIITACYMFFIEFPNALTRFMVSWMHSFARDFFNLKGKP